MSVVEQQESTLQTYLDDMRQHVDRELDNNIPLATEEPTRIHEAMRYSLFAGGKRIRPILVLAAAEAVEGTEDEAILFACGLELIHTYSLVHDDLPAMDDDDMRRGQPACHRQYDEATAILVGDALLTLAFDVMSRGQSKRVLRALRRVATAAGTNGMVGGQMEDLLLARAGASPTVDVEAIEAVHGRKTGALLSVAVEVGGIVGGGDNDEVRALRHYGNNIGLAFQVVDDILDGDGVAAGGRVAQSYVRATQLTEAAVDALAPLGVRGDRLVSLARHLLDRANRHMNAGVRQSAIQTGEK